MNLQIDFWQLVGMLAGVMVSIIGSVIGMARWLAAEYDARQSQRMNAFEEAAKAAASTHAEALRQHVAESEDDMSRIREVSEKLSRLEAEVDGHPTHADVAALYDSINKLAATVNQLVGETRLQSDLMRMLINREVSKP